LKGKQHFSAMVESMNLEQQRIAIAEACGHVLRVVGSDRERWWHKAGIGHYGDDSLPDYPSDLNAMHEAEKVLAGTQVRDYCGHLSRISRGFPEFATAAQRAEAFLRTLGKWEE
jgi:hypothetical protein